MRGPKINLWVVYGLLSAVILLASCTRRTVCPAYQSMFILDPDVRLHTFSLFGEDSLPKAEVQVNKNSYLVIKPINKKRKEKMLHNIPMATIFPPAARRDTTASAVKDARENETEAPNDPDAPAPTDTSGDGF
jgi:hypothetical protein